jgi:hypothetical protein
LQKSSEIFAEETRPMKLQQRIERKKEQRVVEESLHTIVNGEIVATEVRSIEEPQLRVTDRIGVADHASLVAGDYVSRSEIGQIITDAVVAGVTALISSTEPMTAQSILQPQQPPRTTVSARQIVESRVEAGETSDTWTGKEVATLSAIFFGGTIITAAIWFLL